MKFWFRNRKRERQGYLENEPNMEEVTVGELNVRAFKAVLDDVKDENQRILEDKLHLRFDEKFRTQEETIKAQKNEIASLESLAKLNEETIADLNSIVKRQDKEIVELRDRCGLVARGHSKSFKVYRTPSSVNN